MSAGEYSALPGGDDDAAPAAADGGYAPLGRAMRNAEPSAPPAAAPEYLIRRADVTVGDRIGSGSLGEVYRGTYADTNVALKTLHMLRTDAAAQAEWGGALSAAERQHQLELFRHECGTMSGLVHPNILPFIGVVVADTPRAEPLFLATQLIASGTLHDLIHTERYAALRTHGGCLPLATQLIAHVGMFSGLAYLAEERLIHRDVKPANILVVVESGMLVKVLLADFGESKQLTMTMTRVAGTAAGTPLYMAPEMALEEVAKGPKADVFSAGVVMVELNTGTQPNPGPAMRQQGRQRLAVPEEERRAADLAAIRDAPIEELVARCVVDDEAARASAAEMRGRCVALAGEREASATRTTTIFVKDMSTQSMLSLPAQLATTIAELKRQIQQQTGLSV